MKKNSLLGLWVLLLLSNPALAAPLRSQKASPRYNENYVFSDQTGSPWRLFLGADVGYIKYSSLNTSIEGSRSGSMFGGRALIAHYWFSMVADGGLGWEYISAKGTNPTGTQDTISTKVPYLDLSLRYRLGRYLQFGPEFKYSLGTDFGLNDNILSGTTNKGVYLGAQLVHEWERERKFRFGARWMTPISGAARAVNQYQLFFQMGFDFFGEGQSKAPPKHYEQINEYDIDRAESMTPKEPLPMATPEPSPESTPSDLEPIPVATPGPPETEFQAEPTPEMSPAETPVESSAGSEAPAVAAGSKVLLTLGINDLPFGYTDAKLPKAHVARVKSMGHFLGKNSKAWKKLVVSGHTDERGSKEHNMDLSKRRAETVRNLLVEGGAPGAKIVTIGYGEDRPIDRGHTEKAWAKNRRVELQFYGVSDTLLIKKALDQ